MEGYLPVKIGHQDFDKEGDLPTFTIRKKNDNGQIVDEAYNLNGPIVRRVLSPEQAAAEKARHDAALAARMKEISGRRSSHAKAPATHKHHKSQ